MKRILFLHGFFSSGQCELSRAIRESFAGQAEVLSPDLPTDPFKALEIIREVTDQNDIDIIVGNSCGAFYAQIIAPVIGTPALLGNPHLRMTDFLRERIGKHRFKSPRRDGVQEFEITEDNVQAFQEVQQSQFRFYSPYYKDKIWGIFGEHDSLADFRGLFHSYYDRSFTFPGAHTPTYEEARDHYVPLIKDLMDTTARKRQPGRYFRHFKGGRYMMIGTAFDSETMERMVLYRALYGKEALWVRPESMFFERIERQGQTINRFLETDNI